MGIYQSAVISQPTQKKRLNQSKRMEIKSAIQFIVSVENLRSKQDLDAWCGDMGKTKLYLYVKRLSSEHWERIRTPKESVRSYYQKMLTGSKIYK